MWTDATSGKEEGGRWQDARVAGLSDRPLEALRAGARKFDHCRVRCIGGRPLRLLRPELVSFIKKTVFTIKELY
jgi:hypothetical protein